MPTLWAISQSQEPGPLSFGGNFTLLSAPGIMVTRTQRVQGGIVYPGEGEWSLILWDEHGTNPEPWVTSHTYLSLLEKASPSMLEQEAQLIAKGIVRSLLAGRGSCPAGDE